MAPTVEDQLCLVDAFLLKFLFYYNFTEEEGGGSNASEFSCIYEQFWTKKCLQKQQLSATCSPFL